MRRFQYCTNFLLDCLKKANLIKDEKEYDIVSRTYDLVYEVSKYSTYVYLLVLATYVRTFPRVSARRQLFKRALTWIGLNWRKKYVFL